MKALWIIWGVEGLPSEGRAFKVSGEEWLEDSRLCWAISLKSGL